MDFQERGQLESSTVIHEITVLPVVGRAENAAVDVFERQKPVISSRVKKRSQSVPRLVACVLC